MSLQSLELMGWLIAAVAGYWCLKPAWQLPFMAAATLAFLLVYAPGSGLALLTIALVTYGAARTTRLHRWAGIAGIVALAAGFFAYKLVGVPGMPRGFVLLGFSFYVLRAIHYLIESEKGTLPDHRLMDFLSYMLFLPTMLVGPIHRFGEFMREARRRRWDAQRFSGGLERVLFGYAKIMVLANYLVTIKMSQFIDRLDSQSALVSYLECLQYGLNLYFQFSGYSDVAIGFALMLGLRVGENFHFPLLKTNINAFWQSWHISLSSWCRDYVYTPAAAVTRQPLAAVLCSMIVLGLWHEASARYLVWGAYHGAGIMVWQAFQGWKQALPAIEHPALRFAAQGSAWFLTFNFVMLSFVITKEADLAAAVAVYRQLLMI